MICNRFADSLEDLTLQVVSVLKLCHPLRQKVDICVRTPEELELYSEAALDGDDTAVRLPRDGRVQGALTTVCGVHHVLGPRGPGEDFVHHQSQSRRHGHLNRQRELHIRSEHQDHPAVWPEPTRVVCAVQQR